MIETANKLYNRNYESFVKKPHPNGDVLTFKGGGAEMSILESELEFHVTRAQDLLKPKKDYGKQNK